MPVAELLLIVMQILETFLLNFMKAYIGIFSLCRGIPSRLDYFVCMYVCITHNHKVIVEALISERIVNDVSESNSIVCCMRERACKGRPVQLLMLEIHDDYFILFYFL